MPNKPLAEVVCECGHRGYLLHDGGDRPTISDVWWLEGFESARFYVLNPAGNFLQKPALENLNPKCLHCGRKDAVRYA